MKIHSEPCFPSDMVLGQLVTERSGRENGIVLSFSSQPPWSNMVMHPVLRAQNPQPRRCGSTVGPVHPAVVIVFFSCACTTADEPASSSVTLIAPSLPYPARASPVLLVFCCRMGSWIRRNYPKKIPQILGNFLFATRNYYNLAQT